MACTRAVPSSVTFPGAKQYGECIITIVILRGEWLCKDLAEMQLRTSPGWQYGTGYTWRPAASSQERIHWAWSWRIEDVLEV
jgi:hypothetical protein